MSAPIAAEVLRELGAMPRTFQSVRGAMLWYRDQLAARLRVNRDPAGVGTPTSREHRDQVQATFAAISHASGNVQDVAWYVCWCETRYGDGIWLSERYGCTRWAFTRRMRRVEKALRERLTEAGVLTQPAQLG